MYGPSHSLSVLPIGHQPSLSSFSRIPNEILFIIFSYVVLKNINVLNNTCREWRVIYKDEKFWKYTCKFRIYFFYHQDWMTGMPWKEVFIILNGNIFLNSLKASELIEMKHSDAFKKIARKKNDLSAFLKDFRKIEEEKYFNFKLINESTKIFINKAITSNSIPRAWDFQGNILVAVFKEYSTYLRIWNYAINEEILRTTLDSHGEEMISLSLNKDRFKIEYGFRFVQELSPIIPDSQK